jgi:hypothetical protein
VDDVKSRHSARKMACADELLDILKAWKQTTQFANAEDWVFASPRKLGRMPLGYTSVWNKLTNTCNRLGIAHVSSHSFRHTYRSWLDALGSPIGLQQRMMRHSSITTTANYGDTVPADLREAHEKWCNGRYSTGTARKALQLTETLGWETGIEPATVGATVRCSTKLSYSHRRVVVQRMIIAIAARVRRTAPEGAV